MKKLLFSFFLATLLSCGNSETTSTSGDTTSTTKGDTTSATSKDTGTGSQAPKDTLQALKLDVAYTCEEARKKVEANDYDITELNILLMKVAQCKNEEWNKANPNDPYVTVVTEETEPNGDAKILFNTIKLSTGEKMAEASKALLGLAVFAKTKDPVTTVVATAIGDYSVDAYLDAAKKDDPLIILLPTLIPSKKLTTDIYKSVTKTKVAKKVEAVVSKPIDHAKKNPEDIIAPTVTVPIKAAKKVIDKIF